MSTETTVWDPFVRLGHWLLAAAFVTAYITGEEWQGVHLYAGYSVLGLVVFRLAWGLVGTRPARFASFLAPFSRVKAHLRAVARLEAPPYRGHNPAGGWAVVAMLTLLLLATLSGLATLGAEGAGPLAGVPWLYSLPLVGAVGEEAWEEVHEAMVNATLLMVLVHLAGVVAESIAAGENLARSMVTGRKHLGGH